MSTSTNFPGATPVLSSSSLPAASLPSSTCGFFGATPGGVARPSRAAGRANATLAAGPVRPSQAVYLRRRLLVAGVVAAMFIALVGVFGLIDDRAGADDGSLAPAASTLYIVQPGDSLWSIADGLAPDADPRPIVDELRNLAGSSSLQVGQRLLIPAGLGG